MSSACYEQQLSDWSDALAAGRCAKVLEDIEEGTADDVLRFFENAQGERFRLLTEELEFVALAFDNFSDLVEQYLIAVPRRTFELNNSDQQRFLHWLQSRPLTDRQRDFVRCQQAEYACHALAREHRAAHAEFQQLWQRSVAQQDPLLLQAGCTLCINPVHVWSHLTVDCAADADASRSGAVIFLVIDAQVHCHWLTRAQQALANQFAGQSSIRLDDAALPLVQPRRDEQLLVCRELIATGLLAIDRPD